VDPLRLRNNSMGGVCCTTAPVVPTAKEVDEADSALEVASDLVSKGFLAAMEGIAAELTGSAQRPSLPADFGCTPADTAVLQGTPGLAYLALALPEGDRAGATVESVLKMEVAFESAPTPTPLFEAMAAEHQARPAVGSDAAPLKVLTFNCGLLSRSHLGGHVSVPDYLTRRQHTARVLFARGDDVLLLTEVFETVDVAMLQDEGGRAGYTFYAGDGAEERNAHGMVIALRNTCVDLSQPQTTTQSWFEHQYAAEYSPGPGLKRGFLAWEFCHKATGRPMCAVCAHTTAFSQFCVIRSLQSRQVGLFVRALASDVVALVGGDFNAAPYYPSDSWSTAKVKKVNDNEPFSPGNVESVTLKASSNFFENACMYPLLLHYGGLVDTASCVAPATDVDAMREVFDGVGVTNAWRTPYGRCVEEAKAKLGELCITATDMNALHFKNYGSHCYFGGRYDYVLLRDQRGVCRVQSAGVTLKEAKSDYGTVLIDGQEAPVTLSDHYGFEAELLLMQK